MTKYKQKILENYQNIHDIPLPLYHHNGKVLKRYVHHNSDKFLSFLELANTKLGFSAVVCSKDWYNKNADWIEEQISLHLPNWYHCHFWRENKSVGVVVVLALKSNKKTSSKINKRIVERAFENKDSSCIFTGNLLSREESSAEHIVPLSRGGNNSVWNLCVSHQELNNDRGNEDFWDYWLKIIEEYLL